MFDTLFSYPSVRRRHREGPLAAERARHLEALAAQGMARDTILCRASDCLFIAEELERWPPHQCFDEEEVRTVAGTWATKRVGAGRASSPRWPEVRLRFAATEFLRDLGRLRPPAESELGRYERELAEFVDVQQEGRWPSEATCRSARWQLRRFFDYLEQRELALTDVAPSDVDAYFQHMAPRWSRSSLRTSGKFLRAWFAYCEKRGWTRTGLGGAVLLPRVYQHEGLPIGPTWDEVGRILDETAGDDPRSLRDHAILVLLSVYGIRSSEVRRLALDDLDWVQDRIRIVRSKRSRDETLPLEPRVGNAIARYLREGRPKTPSRVLFLTLRAPPRPLSAGALHGVVARRLPEISSAQKGRGPHALRHACARHLLEAGRTFKEVGDHLGHRSPDSTRFYAKVDVASLRRVAFEDLGGLA